MQALVKVNTVVSKTRNKVDPRTCIICQSSTREKFVINRSEQSYQVLSETIFTLSSWNDLDCKTILKSVNGNASVNNLKELGAEWHLSCYKSLTHKKKRNTVAKKFQKQEVQEQEESAIDCEAEVNTSCTAPFTRHQTAAYDKKLCFFCDGKETKTYLLHHVSYDFGGKNLKKAVEMSGNNTWKVRLSECISETDAHAIDVLYHRECWTKHVVNVLRKANSNPITDHSSKSLTASDVEFISLVNEFLESGSVACMADLHTTYLNICSSNGLDVIADNVKSRRQLKSFIECEIPTVVFSCPKRKNASERVSLKRTADAAIIQLEEESEADQLKVIYRAAKLLRKSILNKDRWKFEGSLCCTDEVIPEEVSLFFKWCLLGKSSISSQTKRISEIDERTNRLSQILMYECLSSGQVSNTAAESLRHTREMPLQIAVGLSVHQTTRSAQLVEYLHNIGVSVPYARIMDIETRIARSVLARTTYSGGIYIPPDFVRNRFTHFAIDNIDFQEDTPDGKNTLHGTVLVAYQTYQDGDESTPLTLVSDRQKTIIPDTIYEMATCNLPKCIISRSQTLTVRAPEEENENNNLLISSAIEDLMWLLALTIEEVFPDESIVPTQFEAGLTWAAYNSFINVAKPKTKISVLPLIPDSPTDNSVQLTAMQNLKKINNYLQGDDKKLLVTLDLGLYRPVLQLQMALSERNWFLIPGDLHIQMAQLRAVGHYVELTGIPEAWVESGLYSETTVRHILDGKPVRRSLKAHITTLIALSILLLESFYKENPSLKTDCSTIATEMRTAWNSKDRCTITTQKLSMKETMIDLKVHSKLEAFCKEKSEQSSTFKMVKNYMDMVFSMLAFARSMRNANWDLRIAALDDFNKYFFALDLRNYAALCAWHVAEVRSLDALDPEALAQLKSGNWYPNKSNNPFCCLGVDEALEQENRKLKVLGGVVGITRRQQTLTKFFLASPEIAKLTSDANVTSNCTKKEIHHEVSNAISMRQQRNVSALLQCMRSYTNPFQYNGAELINLLTMSVAPEKVKADMCSMPDIGMKAYKEFVTERIVNGTVNLWDTLHKTKLQLCKTTAKKVKFQIKGGTVELKEDRTLFNRLIVLCRSRPEMDLKECVSKYELSVVPRGLFSGDGTMHHVSEKSKLIHHIEELIAMQTSTEDLEKREAIPNIRTNNAYLEEQEVSTQITVAIIDGMAELQSLKLKQAAVCSDLADQFCNKIFTKYRTFSEVHVVFDTYIDNSLKAAERLRRQKGIPSVQYKIDRNTNIKTVTLQKLLSHTKTKDELTEFLSKALLAAAAKLNINVVVAYRQNAEATQLSVAHLKSSHEEADTKLILHAIDATKRGASSLHIFSPDTDVLILAIHNYLHFPKDSHMILLGAKRRDIFLGKAYNALGPLRAAALLGIHAISGADVTGSFNGKGKTSFWRRFLDADDDTLEALASLGGSIIQDETFKSIEKYVCTVYLRPTKKIQINTLGELRWWFFTQKQALTGNMPPTRAALQPAIRRANYQVMEWKRCDVPHPCLPLPTEFGWSIENEALVPKMCDLPCGPEELISLTKCSCTRGRCAPPCKCVMSQLPCTEMCACLGEEETCNNMHSVMEVASDSDEEFECDD